MINIIYMAAGNSRRFGSNKLFYEIDGKTMYRHVLDRLLEIMVSESEGTEISEDTISKECASGASMTYDRIVPDRAISQEMDITVVTQYGQIVDYCNNIHDLHNPHSSSHLHVVYSPDSYKGASYTIKAGIKSVQERYEDISCHYFMFVVADQPYLKKESLIKLINAVKSADCSQAKAFSLRCGGTPGNPCVFHGSLISELLELEGDRGGRAVLKNHDCVYVDIDDPKELCDIDTCDA